MKASRSIIVLAFASAGFAAAASADFSLTWHTTDGGGGTCAAGSFTLAGTTGQPDAGVPMTGGDFTLTGGFWAAGSGPIAPPCPGDTNGDGLVNVNDLNSVILDWGTDGSANGGDLTGPLPDSPPDGVVDVNDLNAVIVGWGACV